MNAWGSLGSGINQFDGPTGVAVGPDGKVYVADRSNDRVQIFDGIGNYLSTIGTGTFGTGNDSLSSPFDVAVSSNNTIYVADAGNARVQVFNSSLGYQATLGTTGVAGTGSNQFSGLTGIAVSSTGTVYVTDFGNERVQEFNSNNVYQSTLGTTGIVGTGSNQFNTPEGVGVAPNGNVYVSDLHNQRVQVFNSSNVYQSTLGTTGSAGSGNNQFNTPVGVSVGPLGTVYVADFNNQRVQIFNSSNTYLGTLGTTGTAGSGNNQFNSPEDVAVGSNGMLYVADRLNNRIVRYFDPSSWSSGVNNFTDASVGPTSYFLQTPLSLNTSMGLNVGGELLVGLGGSLGLDNGSLSAGLLGVIQNGTFSNDTGGAHSLPQTIDAGGTMKGLPYTVNSNEQLELSSGTISFTTLNVSGNFTYVGGSLTSPIVNVNDGGFINQTGTVAFNIASGQTVALNNGQIINAVTLTNNGVLTGSGLITGGFTNASSGKIQMTGNSSLDFAANLINNGQIQIATSANAAITGAVTNNSGSKVSVTGNSLATFYADVTNKSGSTFQVSGGSTAIFFGNVNGLAAITGSGTTDFEGGSSFGPLSATGTAIVGLSFLATSIRDNSLMVNALTTITSNATPNAPSGASVLNNLTISSAGTFDISNNSLIINYTGSGAELLGDTRAELLNHQLISSSADARHALGYGDNAVLGKSTFAGQSVNSNAVLVKFTYLGDANLDGKVNALDFNALATHFGATGKFWTDGDFNYDGTVNTQDFTALANNFNQSPLNEPPILDALVPEPMGVAALGLIAVFRRRRNR